MPALSSWGGKKLSKGLVLIWAPILGAMFAWFPSGDYAPPVVSWVAPSADSRDVDPDAAIMVTFGDGIDSASVRINSFWLSAANVTVEASAIYDERNRSVVLSPAIPLAISTKYMAAIAVDARDNAGNPLTLSRRWSFTTRRDLEQGYGGQILIIASASQHFTKYYSEILRTEGIGSFESIELSQVTDQLLDRFSLAILGEMPLSEAQAAMFSSWVQRGGDLISMRPDKKLAQLLGLKYRGASMNDGYLLIDTAVDPGRGITSKTIQFHGAADLYTRSEGVTEIARLYRDASSATLYPAITLRQIGEAGGQAATFSYDLARSIVYTRQGNPAWVGDERDGSPVIRPTDLFFGAKKGDEHPDWNDLDRVAIPVVDEQQRLLVNMMNLMLEGKAPLPRLWYFPKGHKAVLVMTGDDHGTRKGSQKSFDELKANEPRGCSLVDWECYRATSWMYTTSGLTAEEARAYAAAGFDIGVHVNTGCKNVEPSEFSGIFSRELHDFRAKYRDLPAQTGSRTHCLPWSEWAGTPKVEARYGVRMDLNYYYWPPSWIKDRPGFMTGSGLPMRFADLDGTMIDVYQLPTHLVNESGMSFPSAIEALLDRALGPEGYYGAFGTHYDFTDDFDRQLTAAAKARGVPLVSARQLLDWTDGRNNSHFAHIAWSGSVLTFDAFADPRTGKMLRGMVPARSGGIEISGITRGGMPVDYKTETIKGAVYAIFPVESGTYGVSYGHSQTADANPAE
ncbi:Ig-like domain-containing protein [Sinorhizobium meliloti]|uniref:Ig-like domain-containing protein n=1 Tax=Rhizobium meliloti TaxID=382 RepID=UPI0006147248|nr:Ig-like domain-containing protein [Sinorhizobium meliloti]ASP76228.1 hypothetical protein CDO28_33560 [Sinorhizobium meliloti]KKA13080.1 fibronectin [Sinorhizobium meliloti]MDE3858666.1 Ig-like domain-containing protein [Sinorhizobium meliloti]MDW9446172.1 hypothetical protein [Sinorhizobium meliloti]MDW9476788.1 hypothetical protein [Sinorhizobium meliloti]